MPASKSAAAICEGLSLKTPFFQRIADADQRTNEQRHEERVVVRQHTARGIPSL